MATPESPPHVLDDYIVAVADGAGHETLSPFYAHTRETSYRLVRCDAHVPPGTERNARAAVSAAAIPMDS